MFQLILHYEVLADTLQDKLDIEKNTPNRI